MLQNSFLRLFLLVFFFAIFLYCVWQRLIYIVFYNGPRSRIFHWCIERNERVYKIFHEVCEAAVRRGFKFSYPWTATTKLWVRPLFFYGIAYPFENAIVINRHTADTLNDSDLSALISHELGHLIDYQTQRKNHPFFTPEMVALGSEKFAWAIATFITSSEDVNNFFEKMHH